MLAEARESAKHPVTYTADPHNKEPNASSVKDGKPHSSRNMNVLKCSGSMDSSHMETTCLSDPGYVTCTLWAPLPPPMTVASPLTFSLVSSGQARHAALIGMSPDK